MPTRVDAVIDELGSVQLLSPVRLPSRRRAVVTIFDEAPDAPTTTDGAPGAEPESWTRRYEPVRVIGQGGMSVVHVARDRATGTLVCVKELQPEVATSALEQECRALARLRHPGILRLINFEVRGPRPYLVIEFGQGLPLARYLPGQLLIQPPLAVALTADILDAVAAAHSDGVIHRDLKPDNVLVSADDARLTPKILDFGLAIVDDRDDRDAHTGAGNVVGTLKYMAPEQLAGSAVSGACDVYPVAQMVWEMTTGLAAFPQFPQVVQAKLTCDGLAAPEGPFATSPGLADVIRHCTRLAPGDRPSAEGAARMFRDLLPHLPQQTSLVPSNLELRGRPGDRPAGWFDGLGYVGNVSMNYVSRLASEPNGRMQARLERRGADEGEFGVLMQRVPAAHLAGTLIRIEASVRAEEVRAWAGLWIRADSQHGQVAFKNMHDRPLRGTSTWVRESIELSLPESSMWLNFGVMLVGDGALSVSGVQVSALTRDGRWTLLGLPRDVAGDDTGVLTPDQLT